MRQNVMVIAGLVALITAVVLVTEHATETSMDAALRELRDRVTAGDWEEARQAITRVGDEWNRGKVWLSIGNSGQDIDDFERALAQASVFVELEDRLNALGQVALLLEIWSELERS